MRVCRLLLPLLAAVVVAACSREQPSGLPSAGTPAVTPTATPAAPPPPPPATTVSEAPVVADAGAVPPPLDEQLPPFEATGYTACDDYLEKARQCINTRMGPDDRLAIGGQLKESVRLITASIKDGGNESRIEQSCKRVRALGVKTLAKYGCTDF